MVKKSTSTLKMSCAWMFKPGNQSLGPASTPLDVLKRLLDSCTFAVLVQTGEER